MTATDDAWLWGWDPTPGIVSVWASDDGRVAVWRRTAAGLTRDDLRFRPWMLLAELDDLRHLGARLVERRRGAADRAGTVSYRELEGEGELRYLVRADDGAGLAAAVLAGARRRLGHGVGHLRELGPAATLVLPPEEQYLVATGRTYFRDLPFEGLARMQLDLETTGLDPATDRIFLVALRDPRGAVSTLEADGDTPAAEAELLRAVVAAIHAADPDVLENHNLHGFDLPFLEERARRLGVTAHLGRDLPHPVRTRAALGLSPRPASRGASFATAHGRRQRFTMPGRELIDTLDAVRRHDFAARDLPGHGLKVVARHLGLARADREEIPGDRIHATYLRDPARVRRYAGDDVDEAAALALTLGGAAFALARLAPRRYERLADAGAATGVIDPLLVRAYLHSGAALPAHQAGDGTVHSGAALHLFATGVAHRVIKADVASLYPSLMRAYRIGPARDRLGALVGIVDRLVEQRLAAKARAKLAPPGSAARHTDEAVSAAMKLVVNSAYGYLAAGGLTRFADVHAANRVTAHGRELLGLLCRELAARGVTLLEADTDGVYAAVPASWTVDDERRVVAEVAALLPPLVQLEFEGRYAAMLSHEPKNYALAGYDGALVLRGVAFRSRRAEPFGEAFLRRAIAALFAEDVPGVQAAYLATVAALRRRELPTADVTTLVRLTKDPAEYAASPRRELPYEALLAAGRTTWRVGERIRVYRAHGGRAALYAADAGGGDDDEDDDDEAPPIAAADPRDYDVDHYVRQLRDTFAQRLARALSPEIFAAVFADPDQPSLFAPSLAEARPILTILEP